MIKLAVGLCHNKATALANRQQITNLAALIVTNTEPGTGRVFYTLAGVLAEHECRFYQVVPFGVTRPTNMNLIDSYNVIYGNNDTDKTGDHARFFNWLLKRGTDNGAEVVCYARFPNLIDAADLNLALARLTTTRVFLERVWGKVAHVRLLRALREVRQETLDESLAFDSAVEGLKARIIARGLEWE